MKKLILIILGLLGIVGIAYAAPSYQIFRTLLPETNLGYDLGTSTRQWGNVYAGKLYSNGVIVSTSTGISGTPTQVLFFGADNSATSSAGLVFVGTNLYLQGGGVIGLTNSGNSGLSYVSDTNSLFFDSEETSTSTIILQTGAGYPVTLSVPAPDQLQIGTGGFAALITGDNSDTILPTGVNVNALCVGTYSGNCENLLSQGIIVADGGPVQTNGGYLIAGGTTTSTITGDGSLSTIGGALKIGSPLNAPYLATDGTGQIIQAATPINYWSLNGTSLYPTSTTYQVGIGTTTPSASLHIQSAGATTSTQSIKIANTNAQNILTINDDGSTFFGPKLTSVSSTASAQYAWFASSTNQDPYQFNYVFPANPIPQRPFSINQLTSAGAYVRSPFYMSGYGTVYIGQSNATGQFVVDSNGNFQQIISFVNSNPVGSTLLSVGGANGGTLSLQGNNVSLQIGQTPLFSINNNVNVGTFNSGGTGAYPLMLNAAPVNNYKNPIFYGASNLNLGGVGGQNPSAMGLTLENGDLGIFNANGYGGGTGVENLSNTTITSSTWTAQGNATINATSGAVFTGAGNGVGSITQTAANLATAFKPNTEYAIYYSVFGTDAQCYGFINDPVSQATTTVAASIQSMSTSWRRFGHRNYGVFRAGGENGPLFFRTTEGGLPQSFVFGVKCTAAATITITNISVKEARGGSVFLGSGGSLQIGTSTLGLSGIHVVASTTATSSNVFGTYSPTGTSTSYIRDEGTAGFYFPNATYTLNTSTTNASTTGGNVVYFDTNDIQYRLSHTGTSSKIYVGEAGTYEFMPSVLADASAPNKHIDIWLIKNGTNVPRSNTHYELPLSGETLVTISLMATSSVNDYFELGWASTDDASMVLQATAEATSPTRPASPAVIMTVKKISN